MATTPRTHVHCTRSGCPGMEARAQETLPRSFKLKADFSGLLLTFFIRKPKLCMKAAVERGRISLGLVVFPRRALAALIVKFLPVVFPNFPVKLALDRAHQGCPLPSAALLQALSPPALLLPIPCLSLVLEWKNLDSEPGIGEQLSFSPKKPKQILQP